MISRRVVLCLVAAALVLPFAGPSTAGSQQPNPQSRDELAQAIEGASAEETAAIQQLQTATARRQQLDAQVAALDLQIVEATRKEQVAQAEVERIAAQVAAIQREIDRIKAEIRKSKARLEETAVALYKEAGNGGDALSLLAAEGDGHQIVAGSHYLTVRSRDYQREIDRQSSLHDQQKDAQSDLKKQQALVQHAERAAAAERDRASQLRSQADAQRQQAAAAEQQEQQLLDGIRARKAEFEAQYNALQAQIAASVSRGNPTPGNHGFIWPVNGPVVSPFGYRIHPITGDRRLHTGVDIGASQGTPIKAAGDGVVVSAGWNGGYGNFTVIDHGGGLATAYAHQSKIGVSVGQQVSTGEIIGYVGSTGASTGPHLHWEVRVNGTPVDPMGWV